MASKKKEEKVTEEKVEKKETKKPPKKKTPVAKEKDDKHFGVQLDMNPEELKKSFGMATKAVDKKFDNVFHAFLHEEEKLVTKKFSSGSVGLDMAVGGEGLPYGRILEVWGPEGSGKTSLALEVAWNLQRATGKAVVFIDVEHKFDKMLLKQWKGVGFDPHMTRYEEPFTGEDAFGILEHYVQNPATGIVIVDSISGIRSGEVLAQDDQQTFFGKQAKLISDYLPKIAGMASMTGVPMLFVNQVRANLEAHPNAKGMARLTKPGGKALGHYICISVYVAKVGGKDGTLSDGVRDYGHWCNAWVYKNHAGSTPYKNFQMCLYYGYGFDAVSELVDMSSRLGIISTNGSWLSIDETWKAQGRTNFIELVRQTPDLQRYLWDQIRSTQTGHIQRDAFPELSPEQTIFFENDEGIEIPTEIAGEVEIKND